jgi:hypothetical protein
MNKVYHNRVFENLHDRNSSKLFCDYEFIQCRFESCTLSTTKKPKWRSVVRNVKLENCETLASWVDTAVIEDVVIDGLKTHGLLQCWGAVFKHVTLKGNIGEIMISPFIATAMAKPHEQAAFDQANAEYYKTVDWALDISEGRFVDCEIQRVPAKLIRRDPETQVVITREKALTGEWKKLDLSKTYWATSIKFFLDRGDADLVLVAPKRYSKYQDLLDGLKMLRDAGVAEPD